jgi:hypothetical protein
MIIRSSNCNLTSYFLGDSADVINALLGSLLMVLDQSSNTM